MNVSTNFNVRTEANGTVTISFAGTTITVENSGDLCVSTINKLTFSGGALARLYESGIDVKKLEAALSK